MNTETKTVTIVCPICKKEVNIEIPTFLVHQAQNGMLKIQIPQERCCAVHSFMVFIDKNFKVRGYQYADIEFNMQEKSRALANDDIVSFDVNELIDAIGIDIASIMLRVILVNRPILFLNTFDVNNYIRKTIKFFQEIESDDIKITTRVIEENEIGNKKIEAEDPFVYAVLYKAVLRSPFRDKIKTSLEGNLLKETADIPDRQGQVAFLRRELVRISKIINELATMLKVMPYIYDEDIPKILHKKFNYQIKISQVDGISEILTYRFGKKFAGKIKSKIAASLGFPV